MNLMVSRSREGEVDRAETEGGIRIGMSRAWAVVDDAHGHSTVVDDCNFGICSLLASSHLPDERRKMIRKPRPTFSSAELDLQLSQVSSLSS